MELRHVNHCVYKIRYHMVFCVKYRKKLLLDIELVNFLKNICFEISERYCFEFDAIGSDGDHDGGYIGTVGDGTTSDVIKNYVQNQGNQEEKEAYQQMKIFDF
ncbi:transposase [Methanosarcina mazei]|uniref:Transposase n=1 Tax=Methanosarcina mazei TaxID=2209 RepID=A0A0F8HRP4_METMZ|nr:IS200/IS605 family transposase [Methanosarcina mazei]KKG47145.1 transposase [Methanosarcina mazei]